MKINRNIKYFFINIPFIIIHDIMSYNNISYNHEKDDLLSENWKPIFQQLSII
jgi:hypothetical protein